jgi:hypothetical protein
MAPVVTFVRTKSDKFQYKPWEWALWPTKVSHSRSGSRPPIYTLHVVGEASVAKPAGSVQEVTTLSPNSGAYCSSKSSPSAIQSYGKRQRDDNDDEDDDNRSNGSKRRARTPKPSVSGLRKFACPYYKRDAEKCKTWRSCSGPGWDTVHRVK